MIEHAPALQDALNETVVAATGPAGIARAAALLRAGALVAFPSETVYGLGADATNGRAVAAIFAAKGRPRFNPLIVHLPDEADAAELVAFDDRARQLAAQFWPGPLTLVLPRRPDCPVAELAAAGLPTLAVRVPAHPVARALLRATGRPVAAPSANRSGHVSPTTAAHVLDDLRGRIAMVLAGGRSPVGLESTVLDLSGPAARLLRPGAVTEEEIAAAIGPVEAVGGHDENAPVSPGRLASHYAPRAAVRLEAGALRPGEALLTFGPDLRKGDTVLNLSETGDPAEAAANLFCHLRALDALGVGTIAVAPIPDRGLGRAINDRLRRAAAPRPVPGTTP